MGVYTYLGVSLAFELPEVLSRYGQVGVNVRPVLEELIVGYVLSFLEVE